MRDAPAHRAHLDLLGATSETAGLAASVLGTLALGGGVLAHGVRGDYVHVRRARHLGVVGIRDVVMGGRSRAVTGRERSAGARGRRGAEDALVETVGH